MATKKFDADDFGAFLKLLPAKHDGVALRHAVQVRHDSFHVPEFVAMCRAAGVAIVYAEFARLSGDRRCHRRLRLCPAGECGRGRARRLFPCRARSLGRGRARTGRRAGRPTGLPYVGDPPARNTARHVRVLHQRRQGARARRGAGADRARLRRTGRDAGRRRGRGRGPATRRLPARSSALRVATYCRAPAPSSPSLATRRAAGRPLRPQLRPGPARASAAPARAVRSAAGTARRADGSPPGCQAAAQTAPPQPLAPRRRARAAARSASSPSAQILERHRLARCLDDRRDLVRLGRAEPVAQLLFEIAERKPAIDLASRASATSNASARVALP